jgi:hypothetical protein
MSLGRRLVAPCIGAILFAAGATSTAQAESPKRMCVAASTDAQTLRQEDKLLEARDKLRTCASDPCPAVVKAQCARWLGEIEPQIPTVIVRAQDSAGRDLLDATVTFDGRAGAVGRPETVDPGPHLVVVAQADGTKKEAKFLVVDGDKSRVLLVTMPAVVSAPTQASTPSAIPTGVWVLGGIGVAALATSGVFAFVTESDLSNLRHTCSPTCSDAQMQTGKTHALVTDVALGVGVVALAGAVIWGVVARSGGGGEAGGGVDVRPVAGGAVVIVGGRY